MSSYDNAWLAPKRPFRFFNLCRHRPRCTDDAACKVRVERDITARSAKRLNRLIDESEVVRKVRPPRRGRGHQVRKPIQSRGYHLHSANGGAPILTMHERIRMGVANYVYSEPAPEPPAVSERARRVVTVRRGPANSLAMLRSDAIGAQIVRALTMQYAAPEMRSEAFSHECLWTLSRRTGRWGCAHGFNADA